MMWAVDPEAEAARQLPQWKAFHKACGEQMLFFDTPHRERNKGPHTVIAFTIRKSDQGGWLSFELARASSRRLIDALRQAHHESGRGTPETTAMIDRGLIDETPDYEGLFG